MMDDEWILNANLMLKELALAILESDDPSISDKTRIKLRKYGKWFEKWEKTKWKEVNEEEEL